MPCSLRFPEGSLIWSRPIQSTTGAELFRAQAAALCQLRLASLNLEESGGGGFLWGEFSSLCLPLSRLNFVNPVIAVYKLGNAVFCGKFLEIGPKFCSSQPAFWNQIMSKNGNNCYQGELKNVGSLQEAFSEVLNLCRARHLLGAVRRWVQNRHHQPVMVRDPRLSSLRGQSTSSAVHWISADQPEAQEEIDHHRTHTHPLPPGVTPGVAGGTAADAPAGRECLEPPTCPQGRVDLGCPVQPHTRPGLETSLQLGAARAKGGLSGPAQMPVCR